MSSQRIIDSHSHIQFPAYDTDRAQVISRAREAGVGIINVGTQFSTSEDALALAREYPGELWASVGFHPGHTDLDAHHDPMEFVEKQQEFFDYEKFLKLARAPEVVAIGECGLDYYRNKNEDLRFKNGQREVFEQQIQIAKEVGKPLVIHCRSAFADLIKILKSNIVNLKSDHSGVVHFFSGSWDDAKKLIDRGFYLGFGGVITFAREYDEVVKKAPLDRILLETDAPYVAPVPYRGKRNEPAYIMETATKIGEIRREPFEEIAEVTTANARKLSGL